jgi:hypothetical protein
MRVLSVCAHQCALALGEIVRSYLLKNDVA